MEIRKDILGNTPKLCDKVVFNPPRYKGLICGEVIGFSSGGLPQLKFDPSNYWIVKDGYTPKTGFVVAQNNNYQIY